MSKGEGIILGLPVLGGKVQLSWDVLQKKGGGVQIHFLSRGWICNGMTQCIRSILTFEQQKRPYLKVGDEARKGLYPKWWSIPLQLTPIIIIGETN